MKSKGGNKKARLLQRAVDYDLFQDRISIIS